MLDLINFLAPLGRHRARTAIYFALSSLMLAWRLLMMPLELPTPPLLDWLGPTLFGMGLTFLPITWLAAYLARRPRHSVPLLEFASEIEFWSSRFGLSTQRAFVSGVSSAPDAAVRGLDKASAIVISTKGHSLWRKSPEIRTAQLVHELSHLKSRDQNLYYYVRALSIVSVILLLYTGAVILALSGPRRAAALVYLGQILVLAALTFLASRAFLRFREHIADVNASVATGDEVLISSGLSVLAESAGGRIWSSHPGRTARQAVVLEPRLVLLVGRFSDVLFGLAVGVLTSLTVTFLTPFSAGLGIPGSAVFYLSAFAAGIAFSTSFSARLLELRIFGRKAPYLILVALASGLFGVFLGVAFLNPLQNLPVRGTISGWLAMVGVTLLLAVFLMLVNGLVLLGVRPDGYYRFWAKLLFWGSVVAGVVVEIWCSNHFLRLYLENMSCCVAASS